MTRAILLCTTVALVVVSAAVAPAMAKHATLRPVTYTVAALPNPLGGSYAQGTSINSRLQIAGFATLAGNTTMRAMLWQPNRSPIDMGTLGGPNSAVAWPNRNNHGAFAGIAETMDKNPLGEPWSCALAVFYIAPPTGDICLGFRWQNGTMTALPTLGGYDGFATGINNRGQIVGWAENTYHDPTCNAPQVLQFEAVLWDPENVIEELPPYGSDADGAATAINSRAQVVGISGDCANAIGGASAKHMVLWQGKTVTSLPTLGGNYWNTPMDINENGTVTGFSDLPGDSPDSPNFNAFLWTKSGGTINLGVLAGDSISEGLGINDENQVVGVSYPSSHAFIWQNGTLTDLNTLTGSNSRYELIDAQEISDNGVITGEALDTTNGAIVAFEATPK